MNATCFIFCGRTRRQLFAVPCVSVELARLIAITNPGTWNVVQGGDLWAGYANGAMACCGALETVAWMRKQGLNIHGSQPVRGHDLKQILESMR